MTFSHSLHTQFHEIIDLYRSMRSNFSFSKFHVENSLKCVYNRVTVKKQLSIATHANIVVLKWDVSKWVVWMFVVSTEYVYLWLHSTVEHTKRVEKSSLDTLLIFSELKGLVHICMYHHEGLSFRSWLHHMASRHMAVTWCNMAVKTPTQQTTLGEGSPDWLVVKSD